MLDVVPLRYGTAFKKAFSDPLAFHALVLAALGIDFTPDRIEQEYSYPQPVARVNVTYDLFAEDTTRRTIVELQHIREPTTYDRFLYYHCIGLAEQIESSKCYKLERDVYTLVVFTRWPDEPAMRFGRAVSDMDPVTDEGRHLGVYRHRMVFINARAPEDQIPPALRPLLALMEDTLDGRVDGARYPDEVSQHILTRILWDRMTPDENARVKEETGWEDARRESREEGLRAGEARGQVKGLCEAYGLTLTPAQETHLASLDLAGLEALRVHLKQHRAWPS